MDHIHTRQHREDREIYFSYNPLCERCKSNGITTASFILHHRDRDQSNRTWSNFEALCNDCHELEHGRKSLCGCDVNGLPTNDKHWWK